MGKIVEKKKKKKGRPSLLDLQKRNLKEQQELLHQHNKRHLKKLHHPHARNNFAPRPRDNYDSATPVRRSARRNPNPEDDDDDDDGGGDSDSGGKRREKKLKLVLRLPPGEDHEAAAFDSGGEDSSAAVANGNKKRRINAISDGSGIKGDKSVSGTNQSNAFQGAAKLDSGPSTPLPDKKLLVFILDGLQKKDTYGVFSDPVDSEELPDYHEVIEHPMDFGTVRKKLSGGAYANLEHFEKDVFLICSNAMQYNAPETVYFRQARSILELAKKNFENLRQDSDDNEPEPKVVARRGRPPTKNLKKPIGRPSLEALGSEFSSDVALATGGENATFSNHDLRKGSHFSDKSSLADSGRLHGLRSTNDLYSSLFADNKLERNDEFTGSSMRNNMKLVKKQVVHEESRRNTYIHPHPSASPYEPSVLKTFDAERKQLMPVGVLVEHGYARSLARFAANLGPFAWKVAAKKIERSLPGGTKFGPGWVGENDLPQRKMPHFPSLAHSVGQPSVSHHSPDLPSSSHIRTSCDVVESRTEVSSEIPEGEDISGNHVSCSSTIASEIPVATTGSSASPLLTSDSPPESIAPKPEPSEGSNPHSGFPVLNSSIAGMRPKSPFPARQGPTINPGMNGFNGFNLAAQKGKLSGLARPPGFNIPSQMLAKGSKINDNNNCDNKIHSETVNISTPEDTNKVLENRSTISAGTSLPDQGNGVPVQPPPGCHPRPSWPQQKPESVPPDLNVRFQSPASPSSSRVDSTQPDLALQL